MNEARPNYPIGVQNFIKLRESGLMYVDKTEYIYEIVSNPGYYFISRPRRFGKSLLLSTIEAYYEGKRELFKGLAIDSLTDDWEPHPVLHLDLNIGHYENPDELTDVLSNALDEWEAIYGTPTSTIPGGSPSIRFNRIIRQAYKTTGKKVVILVDEYDKPLLNTIHLPELAESYRSLLKAFYSNLKTMDEYIEMAMLTGVARFSKVSIFSDLNNLNDITFDRKYAGICGITAEELESCFGRGIHDLATESGKTEEEIKKELKKRYDGYHFSEISPDIYNPFSLVNVFGKLEMSDYWFTSGTPSFLVRLIEKGVIPFRDIAPVEIDKDDLKSAGLLSPDPIPAFYQTGYLTIKGTDNDLNLYILDYPNEEVKRGFLKFLLLSSIPDTDSRRGFSIPEFVKDVRGGKPESFMQRMDALIASIPYNEKGSAEDHFQNAVYLLFTLLGYYTRMEDRTSDGRIDLQVDTDRFIYIFEFKIDSTAEAAMEQIYEKKYWLRESSGDRKIYLIGANFDTSTRRLSSYLIRTPDDQP